MIKFKPLLWNLAFSFGVGALSRLVTKQGQEIYNNHAIKPVLSPPDYIFPIVWSALFLLMGVSAYLISIAPKSQDRQNALKIYLFQLCFNFIWSIIFFNLGNFLLSFIWLIFLWVLIIKMIRAFYKINPLSGRLQLPYLVWVTFAGYLNFMVYILNR